jgi:hypothetical protein
MYSVTFKTKRGGSGAMRTESYDEVVKKIKSLFRQRLTGTAYKNGERIGQVYEDNSQRTGMNYYIETEEN